MKWWQVIVGVIVEKIPAIIRAIKGDKDEDESEESDEEN